MNTRRTPALALCLGLAAACGSASHDNPGNQDLALEVHTKGDSPPAGTEFMVAYVDPHYSFAIDLAEGNVSGSSKDGFSVHLGEAPPELVTLNERDGKPKLALGGFSMVDEKRPAKLYKTVGFTSASCPGPVDDAQMCIIEIQACTLSGDECYSEKKSCNAKFEQCTITSQSGNHKLITDDAYAFVRDISNDYALLYLAQDLDPSSLIAKAIGGVTKAGYHLMQPHPNPADDNGTACDAEADQLALSRYNAAHGTHYATRDKVPESDDHHEEHEFYKLDDQADADLGCFVMNQHLTEVAMDKPITITLKAFKL